MAGPHRPGRPAAAIALLLVGLLVGCGEPLATAAPVFVQAGGSASMAPLLAELAAAYHQQVPGVQIEVTGLGTAHGLRALEDGQIDLALASWLPGEMLPAAGDWPATAIARDGLAIVVHPQNPLDGLGLLQLQDLFSGRSDEWAALGAPAGLGEVVPVSRELGSGTRAAFEALVMEGKPVTPRALLAPSPAAVVEAVASQPAAIGYLSLGDVTPAVKVLKVEGDLPAPRTVGQGTYPLSRDLWLVTAGPPAGAVAEFLSFVLSPAGQQVVGRRYGPVR